MHGGPVQHHEQLSRLRHVAAQGGGRLGGKVAGAQHRATELHSPSQERIFSGSPAAVAEHLSPRNVTSRPVAQPKHARSIFQEMRCDNRSYRRIVRADFSLWRIRRRAALCPAKYVHASQTRRRVSLLPLLPSLLLSPPVPLSPLLLPATAAAGLRTLTVPPLLPLLPASPLSVREEEPPLRPDVWRRDHEYSGG